MTDNFDKLESANTPENTTLTYELLNTNNTARKAARIFGAIFLLAIPVLFIPWQQNIRGTGKVTPFHPKDRPQTVNSTIAGRIEEWYVAEGQYVESGDPILRISEIKAEYFDPEYITRIQEQLKAKSQAVIAYEQKMAALRRQLQSLDENMRLELQTSQNKAEQQALYVKIDSAAFQAAKTQYQIAEIQYNRQKNLVEQGIKPQQELEQYNVKFQESAAKIEGARNKWEASQTQLVNALIEVNSKQAEYMQKIAKTESELQTAQADMNEAQISVAKLRNELRNLEVRNDLYTVRAPREGMVVRALLAGIGEMIKDGDPIVTILPHEPEMGIELYFDPVDAPLLSRGTEVFIQFDGWPALQFSGWPGIGVGTFAGKVSVVDYVNSQSGKFRVLIVPDEDSEWPKELRIGTGVYGWAMLKTVPMWYELWRVLNGFPPDFYKAEEAKTDLATK